MTTYNGWANWETWNVALWLQNNYPHYALACKFDRYDALIPYLEHRFGQMTPDGARWMDGKIDTAALDEMLSDLWTVHRGLLAPFFVFILATSTAITWWPSPFSPSPSAPSISTVLSSLPIWTPLGTSPSIGQLTRAVLLWSCGVSPLVSQLPGWRWLHDDPWPCIIATSTAIRSWSLQPLPVSTSLSLMPVVRSPTPCSVLPSVAWKHSRVSVPGRMLLPKAPSSTAVCLVLSRSALVTSALRPSEDHSQVNHKHHDRHSPLHLPRRQRRHGDRRARPPDWCPPHDRPCNWPDRWSCGRPDLWYHSRSADRHPHCTPTLQPTRYHAHHHPLRRQQRLRRRDLLWPAPRPLHRELSQGRRVHLCRHLPPLHDPLPAPSPTDDRPVREQGRAPRWPGDRLSRSTDPTTPPLATHREGQGFFERAERGAGRSGLKKPKSLIYKSIHSTPRNSDEVPSKYKKFFVATTIASTFLLNNFECL